MHYEIGKYSIDTPEQVAIEFNIAGIGSRFMAVLIDNFIQAAITIAAVLLGAIVMSAGKVPALWSMALLILWVFLVYWGYFTYFETKWAGQTPGKKLVKIRVIKTDGRPIGLMDAMVRNLIRVIDYLPSAYLVGIVSMFVDSKNRRLGDFAAGTLVVHDREENATGLTSPLPTETAAETGATYDVRNLGTNDLILIETFLARRFDINPEARFENGDKLATMIRTRLGISEAEAPNDEEFLEKIARALRDTARLRS
jgi:uncharacterized RDD family membrane protein YckC